MIHHRRHAQRHIHNCGDATRSSALRAAYPILSIIERRWVPHMYMRINKAGKQNFACYIYFFITWKFHPGLQDAFNHACPRCKRGLQHSVWQHQLCARKQFFFKKHFAFHSFSSNSSSQMSSLDNQILIVYLLKVNVSLIFLLLY